MSESNESLPYDARLRRNPSHLGGFVSDRMEDSNGNRMPVAEATCKLGVSVPSLYRVLKASWGKADAWLHKQAAYDLAREQRRLGQWPSGASYPEDAGVEAEAA